VGVFVTFFIPLSGKKSKAKNKNHELEFWAMHLTILGNKLFSFELGIHPGLDKLMKKIDLTEICHRTIKNLTTMGTMDFAKCTKNRNIPLSHNH
jgi:hypothetical protein